ncbi:MAG: hypothetical protein AB7V06_09980 [Candidatus Obscuribacterales bacterium]
MMRALILVSLVTVSAAGFTQAALAEEQASGDVTRLEKEVKLAYLEAEKAKAHAALAKAKADKAAAEAARARALVEKFKATRELKTLEALEQLQKSGK